MRAKDFIPASKPRNFVAKNSKTAGAGQHKDKKRAEKQGDVKHKKPYDQGVAEGSLNEASSDEAWELVGQPVPEIQQFVKQMGYGDDDQSVAKITAVIDRVISTQLPVASIPKLKNLANKGTDVQTLKAVQQISGKPDAEQQYTKLMKARDAAEGRERDVSGYLQYVKSGNYDPPVLLKLPTGIYVIGGRTRLYAALALGVSANVKIVSANDFKQGVAEGSLNEFAPGAGDEDGSEDPYKYPKPERYRRSADYFGRFEADHFDREDFNDDTGVFKGYWDRRQIAYFKFDNPEKTGGDDPGMGWYYEPDSDSNGDNTSSKSAGDNADERKQQELSMINAFLKSGQTPKSGSQIHSLMKRHGLAKE